MDYAQRAVLSSAKSLAHRSKGGKGQTIKVTIKGESVFDPQTQAATAPAPVVHVGSGIELGYEIREIDGTKIKVGDKKLLLSPKKQDGSNMPTFDAKAKIEMEGGAKYSVVRCDPLQPTGLPIMFEVQVRGPG